MLEDWAICLSSWLKYIQHVNTDNTIAERMQILRNEWKLRMQLWAILSQIHKHKEALIQAQKSVKLIHHLFKDLYDLWIYYVKRQDLETQLLLELKEKFANNLFDFDSASLNELNEESLTLTEKTACKLLPIIEEIIKRMVKEQTPFTYWDDIEMIEKPDMRNILGFLNQNEWVYNLNIGNVMQIPSISHVDLMNTTRTEYELSRESFLEKLTILWVAYFCTSTELRFILQLKEEEKWNIAKKEIESEFWHAKSLEIATVFFPSECPLLSHILLSYQKHHSPIQYAIPEESEYNDNLAILKPLTGMQSGKFNPIIRITPKPDPVLTPYPLSPLRKITNALLSKVEENEVKTIVTQSIKHTQQNSVVAIEPPGLVKDNWIKKKDSSRNPGKHLKEDGSKMEGENTHEFEDAYDDSKIMERSKEILAAKIEEQKNMHYQTEKAKETNVVQSRNHNSNTQMSWVPKVQNIDVGINTDDVEEAQPEPMKPEVLKRTVSTNTIQNVLQSKSSEMLIEDPINSLVNDLEQDENFIQTLSTLVREKLTQRQADLLHEDYFDSNNNK
jgi:hypothetical protein